MFAFKSSGIGREVHAKDVRRLWRLISQGRRQGYSAKFMVDTLDKCRNGHLVEFWEMRIIQEIIRCRHVK